MQPLIIQPCSTKVFDDIIAGKLHLTDSTIQRKLQDRLNCNDTVAPPLQNLDEPPGKARRLLTSSSIADSVGSCETLNNSASPFEVTYEFSPTKLLAICDQEVPDKDTSDTRLRRKGSAEMTTNKAVPVPLFSRKAAGGNVDIETNGEKYGFKFKKTPTFSDGVSGNLEANVKNNLPKCPPVNSKSGGQVRDLKKVLGIPGNQRLPTTQQAKVNVATNRKQTKAVPKPKAVPKRKSKSAKKVLTERKSKAETKEITPTDETDGALETGDAPATDGAPETQTVEQARTDAPEMPLLSPATPTSVSTTSGLIITPTPSRKPDSTAASSVKTCKHCPVLGCSKCRYLQKGCAR